MIRALVDARNKPIVWRQIGHADFLRNDKINWNLRHIDYFSIDMQFFLTKLIPKYLCISVCSKCVKSTLSNL